MKSMNHAHVAFGFCASDKSYFTNVSHIAIHYLPVILALLWPCNYDICITLFHFYLEMIYIPLCMGVNGWLLHGPI
jgi:hypothetical protein